MKLVIAATGASGTIYLQRLLDQIDSAAHEIHLILSGHARQVAVQEVDELRVPAGVGRHSENDLNVPYVSGSARFQKPLPRGSRRSRSWLSENMKRRS